MPIYVYFCETCNEEFEAFQSFSAKPLAKHDVCGGKARKVFLPASIVFKGSGFYATDSRSSASSGSSRSSSSRSSRSSSGPSSPSSSSSSGSTSSPSSSSSDE